MTSAQIAATSEKTSRHLVEEETVLAPAGSPIWRRPASVEKLLFGRSAIIGCDG